MVGRLSSYHECIGHTMMRGGIGRGKIEVDFLLYRFRIDSEVMYQSPFSTSFICSSILNVFKVLGWYAGIFEGLTWCSEGNKTLEFN